MFDSLSFGPFSLFDYGFSSTEVGIGGRPLVGVKSVAGRLPCLQAIPELRTGRQFRLRIDRPSY